ncbi:MAG: hypothetical protein ACE5JO_12685 [Candidatus Binatia bacterium]
MDREDMSHDRKRRWVMVKTINRSMKNYLAFFMVAIIVATWILSYAVDRLGVHVMLQ